MTFYGPTVVPSSKGTGSTQAGSCLADADVCDCNSSNDDVKSEFSTTSGYWVLQWAKKCVSMINSYISCLSTTSAFLYIYCLKQFHTNYTHQITYLIPIHNNQNFPARSSFHLTFHPHMLFNNPASNNTNTITHLPDKNRQSILNMTSSPLIYVNDRMWSFSGSYSRFWTRVLHHKVLTSWDLGSYAPVPLMD